MIWETHGPNDEREMTMHIDLSGFLEPVELDKLNRQDAVGVGEENMSGGSI